MQGMGGMGGMNPMAQQQPMAGMGMNTGGMGGMGMSAGGMNVGGMAMGMNTNQPGMQRPMGQNPFDAFGGPPA